MTRILTEAVLVPLVVGVVLYAPLWAFLLVLALVGLIAYFEFDSITAAHGFPRSGWPGMAFGAIWMMVPDRMELSVLMLAVVTLMLLAALRTKDLARALGGSACGVMGILYIFGAWRCAIGL